MPVVRERVTFTEVLRDIRTDQVAAIHWWGGSRPDVSKIVSGECLIEYSDGTLKQSYLPVDEPRCAPAV